MGRFGVIHFGAMNTKKHWKALGMCVLATFFLAGCADRSASPEKFGDEGGDEAQAGKALEKDETNPAHAKQRPISKPPAKVTLADGASQGLVKAKKLLDTAKFEELLDVFSHKEAQDLPEAERGQLGEIYYSAAYALANKRKDVAFSSMMCERGLLVTPKHQGLMRLQVRNYYLHPDMKLVSGAEELAERLIQLDGEDLENQFLRGKVAFEQADWDTAVIWLKKAARVGRTQGGKMIDEAWSLLDLAKGRQEEMNSALSMTRELEVRMKRVQIKARSAAVKADSGGSGGGGSGGPAALSGGKVVLFMTSWCKYCRKTADLLKSLNVKFEQKDIEKDQSALMEMMQLAQSNGVEVRGVPVVRIGSKLVVGYNEPLIKSLVSGLR